MAVIFSGTRAWGPGLFDFATPIALNEDSVLTPRSTLFPGSFTYDLYGVSVVLRQKSVTVTHTHEQTGGGIGTAIMGRSLTVDGDGQLTGGTIAVISQARETPEVTPTVIGISLPVADFLAAAATRGLKDDLKVIERQLTGDDLAGLSGRRDVFNAGTGRDLIFGNDGNDVLRLGAGQDAGIGGKGNDRIIGGDDSDLLFGNEGKDKLFGGAGNDVLDGGLGRDVLAGGAGADVFHFVPGDGRDVIRDFDPDADLINIGGGVSSFAGVTVESVAAGTRVSFADVSILLRGVDAADIGAADFRFVANGTRTALFAFDDIFDNFIKA